jgi:hypothetical protein
MLADQYSEFNKCVCSHGHGGIYCDEVCPLRCENTGTCRTTLDDPTVYECVCRGLYTGDLCEIPFAICPDHTLCFHGGSCAMMDNVTRMYGCHCPPGFDGSLTCNLNWNHTQIPTTLVAEIEGWSTTTNSRLCCGYSHWCCGALVGAILHAIRAYSKRLGYHRDVTTMKNTMTVFI